MIVPLSSLAADSPTHWTTISDDLEQYQVSQEAAALFEKELLLFRTSLRRFRIGVVRAREFGKNRSDVKTLAESSNAALLVNANFFDEQDKALGLIVGRGNTYQAIHRGGDTLTGIFQIKKNHPSIIYRSSYLPEGVIEAVQAGPRLLAGGRVVPGLRDRSGPTRRAGICIDQIERVIFFCTAPGLGGVAIEELQQILLSDKIGCREALNLDGGGSAQLYVNVDLHQKSEVFLKGRDEVPVAIGLFPLK